MKRPIILGVAGGSASGKTTVVQEVVRLVGAVRTSVIEHDSYYHDLSHLEPPEREQVNVDHPDSLETELMVRHVSALVAGSSVDVPVYDYASHTRTSEVVRIDPAPLIVLEGILVLADRRLRELMDLRVFVQTEADQRLERRLARDVVARGRTPRMVQNDHIRRVEPMHARFVQPSVAHADVTIIEGGHNLPAIESLAARVRELLEL